MTDFVNFDQNILHPTNGKVFPDILELKYFLEKTLSISESAINLIMVSGGFDPITFAHIRYIQTASRIYQPGRQNKLVVVANRDSWLVRKKGYAFMPEMERMEILSAIKGVDFVTMWDDGSKDVTGCIKILKPNIFANGGDRSSIENVPEYITCKELNCQMYFGVGGVEKLQSSSNLIKNLLENKNIT